MSLHSQSSSVIVSKFWGPTLCVVGPLLIIWGDSPGRSFFLAVPFFIAAIFGASLAVLRVQDGILYYRRLLRWKEITGKEIVS